MPILTSVKPGAYHDSVRLMRVSEVLAGLSEVRQAMAAMGTDANKRVLAEAGLLTDELHGAEANDLVIVVEAGSDAAARNAITEAERILAASDRPAGTSTANETPPKTLEQAQRKLADANMVLISVPGV